MSQPPAPTESRHDSLPSPLRREARCCIPGAAWMNSKEGSWVSWPYPDPKGERNNRMPGKRRSGSDVRAEGSRDPRDKAKAELLEAQSPHDERERPPERHPMPAPCPATASRVRPTQPSGRAALPSEGNQGDEWDAYVTLGRTAATNAGSPTGREPHGHGVPIVVVRFTPHHQPAIDRPPRDPRHPRDRRDPPTPMRARLRSTPPPPATLIKRRAHRLPPHRDRALIDHTTKFNTPP